MDSNAVAGLFHTLADKVSWQTEAEEKEFRGAIADACSDTEPAPVEPTAETSAATTEDGPSQ